MEAAGEYCRGATAYVNMEPGDCHGDYTAVSAFIKAGITRLVIGIRHPLQHLRGKAIQTLRAEGLQVDVLGEDIRSISIEDTLKSCLVVNAPLLYRSACRVPFSVLNVHGAALGAKEVDATRQNLGWPYEPFHIPDEVKKHWSRHTPEGAPLEAEWNAKSAEYEKKYPEEAAELKSIATGVLPAGWEKALSVSILHTHQKQPMMLQETSQKSQTMLNALAPVLPGLIGESADLASSNMTLMKMFGDFQKPHPKSATFDLVFGNRVWEPFVTGSPSTAPPLLCYILCFH
ncbi:hypothetical protein M8C21_012225 [Ambrosia artemisiifolia]|uniref:CMP/dCMP-type deaminase domain-containing protein n=1 Tax=Ambrosia artemisiifolia TaxID=4212 RepID=A0AAD5G7C6_AMBAR|nr:hypothetical protein M8C21_012225 [Ambrosia artemisiifolia]